MYTVQIPAFLYFEHGLLACSALFGACALGFNLESWCIGYFFFVSVVVCGLPVSCEFSFDEGLCFVEGHLGETLFLFCSFLGELVSSFIPCNITVWWYPLEFQIWLEHCGELFNRLCSADCESHNITFFWCGFPTLFLWWLLLWLSALKIEVGELMGKLCSGQICACSATSLRRVLIREERFQIAHSAK